MDKSVVVLSPRTRASLTLMPFILLIVGRAGAADGNACLLLKTSRIMDGPSTHSGENIGVGHQASCLLWGVRTSSFSRGCVERLRSEEHPAGSNFGTNHALTFMIMTTCIVTWVCRALPEKVFSRILMWS
jgi:hypothetical protein